MESTGAKAKIYYLSAEIQELTKEKFELEERYDAEVITVQALHEYLKLLETDYQQIIQETEKEI